MTPAEAIAYLTPHEHTADTASISLTAGKMREAVGVLVGLPMPDPRALAAELIREIDYRNAYLESWEDVVKRVLVNALTSESPK